MNNYTYNAFISYRQKYDMDIAKPLLRNLEHYHIPFGIQKNFGKKQLKIFRDKDELRAGNDLPAEIRKALRNSEFLIVICSPDAKEALWILKEINYFRKTHGNSNKNIITVLKKGEPQEAIPDILLHPTEPSYVDYRKKRLSRGLLLGLNKELPRIASKLIGCEYDELIQRRKAFERMRMLIIATLVSLFSCLLTSNIINFNIAQHEKAENLSYLSENAYNNYDRENAVEHAISALSTKNIPEAKRALLTATETYKFKQEEMGVIRNIQVPIPIKEYDVYSQGNGKYISILGKDASIRVYNVKTGEEVLFINSDWTLDETAQSMQITDVNEAAHIIMCDENRVLFCYPKFISSFDIDKYQKKHVIDWQIPEDPSEEKLKYNIDSSPEYINLSYNSNSITVGLENGTIIILNKKTGRQIDSITPSKTISEIKDNQPIHAKISPDSRYLICRNESCAYLYDRNTREFSVISNELHSKYQDTDEHIMGNFYLLAYGNRETKDVHILCYDIKRKTIVSENHIKNMREHCTPWFIPLENATINGETRDITIAIIDNTMTLFDCNSGKIISETQFTNRIQHAFLQKRDTKDSPATHDYGILTSECNEDVLTVIFENGECADYSFQNETISDSYKTFKDGVVSVEKSNNYYFISHQNNLNGIKNDNTTYSVNFNIKTHQQKLFTNSILIYGKRQTNTDWKKITNDYDHKSSVFPYKSGFLIFQSHSCIYYDVKKDTVIWENKDINYIDNNNLNLSYENGVGKQNPDFRLYKFLGTDASKEHILIGSLEDDLRYKIQFLDGANGTVAKTRTFDLKSVNDNSNKTELSDLQNIDGKLFFSVKSDDEDGMIIAYNLESGEYHRTYQPLNDPSGNIKILSVSPNGQQIFCSEQVKTSQYLTEQSYILDIKDGYPHSLESDEDILENLRNVLIIPNPSWSEDGQYIAFRSSDKHIFVFSKSGDYKYSIDTNDYNFAGFCFFENMLYVIGEADGTPTLFRYAAKSGKLLDRSELKGYNNFGGNVFDIKCIKASDSEVIMILTPSDFLPGYRVNIKIGIPFHNAWIIHEPTGKSIAFLQQGAAYNPDIDYLFANGGIVKRYTTKELKEKATHINEIP